MADYEVLAKYRKEQLNKFETVLKKSSELIAFIKVYGALYDNNYNGLILNVNNLNEHYLQTSNSEVIDNLYNVYSTAKKDNKSEQEIFEQLRAVLYELPVFAITETNDRSARHK